jgi:uridine kinase
VPITPFFIGIAGGSCSGKTSIAVSLSDMVDGGVLIVGLDSYYHDCSGVPEQDIEVDVPWALDRLLLIDQLRTLAGGKPVEKPAYDYSTHTRRPKGVWINPGDYVVVEGLFALFWPDVRDLFDVCVFVTVDHDTALARRISRDIHDRGRTETSVRAQYREKVRPNYEQYVLPTRELADLVVDGLDPVETCARAIRERLP